MALKKYQVAFIFVIRCAEEMIEANIIEGCSRRKAGNMPAEFTRFAIGVNHNRGSIPADYRTDGVLYCLITRNWTLSRDRNGIHIRSIGGIRKIRA